MEEEERMQEEWRRDPKKCTFIVLSKVRTGSCKEERLHRITLLTFRTTDLTDPV